MSEERREARGSWVEGGGGGEEPRLRRPIWWRRIHWRLMASYVLLAAFVIGTIWIFLSAFLDRAFEQERSQALTRDARLAAVVLVEAGGGEALQPAVERIGQELGSRVVLLSEGGEVVADSRPGSRTPGQPVEGAALAQALAQGASVAVRDDAFSGRESLIALVAVEVPGREGRTLVRLATPLSELHAATDAVWATLTVAAIVAVLVAGILGFVASRFFSRPLSELSLMALRIAGGDFSHHVGYPVADEVGLLGDSLDHLSSELSEKLRLLTEEKSRLSTILRSMGEGVFVIDARGRVVLVNPAVRQMLGLASVGVEGKPIEEVSPTPQLTEAFQRVMERGEGLLEEVVIRRGKQRADVMVSIAPISEQGSLLGTVAVLNDISQVRRLERIRRDFVANVSHELRTPLTAVRGYAETLLSAGMELPAMATEFIETILRHTIRLSRLIDDLLTLASIEGRGLDSRLEAVDAGEVIDEVTEVLERLAGERQIQLETRCPPGLIEARAERRALHHILTNLLENAVKYTPQGGRVVVTATPGEEHIEIMVSDNGVGIPAEHLPRIFERFYRVDEGRSRDVGGSGLGLALVKHLVHTLGASIDVESEVGRGTVFTLRLQRA